MEVAGGRREGGVPPDASHAFRPHLDGQAASEGEKRDAFIRRILLGEVADGEATDSDEV